MPKPPPEVSTFARSIRQPWSHDDVPAFTSSEKSSTWTDGSAASIFSGPGSARRQPQRPWLVTSRSAERVQDAEHRIADPGPRIPIRRFFRLSYALVRLSQPPVAEAVMDIISTTVARRAALAIFFSAAAVTCAFAQRNI